MPTRGREWSAATAVGLVLARRTAPKVETSGAAVCCPLVERLVVTVYGTRESTGARRRGRPHSRAPSTTPDQINNYRYARTYTATTVAARTYTYRVYSDGDNCSGSEGVARDRAPWLRRALRSSLWRGGTLTLTFNSFY